MCKSIRCLKFFLPVSVYTYIAKGQLVVVKSVRAREYAIGCMRHCLADVMLWYVAKVDNFSKF